MRYLIAVALPLVGALTGCAYTKSSSPGSAPTQSAGQQNQASATGAGGAPPSTTAPPTSTSAPASTSANPSPSKSPASAGSGSSAPRQTSPAKDAKSQSQTTGVPKQKSPPAKSEPSKPATASATGTAAPAGSTAPAAPSVAAAPAVPGAAKPNPPTPSLDLASLEQRLKDTKAIGLFTKLSLKNQVDDLLSQFRAFYDRKSSVSLAELRQRYDGLLLKVLSLLQDGDPPLASAISGSREAIWGILSDPRKFAKL